MSLDRVLVVIGRTRHKMVAAELLEAVKRGTAFIELRLDFLAKAIDFKRLAPYKKCPWVATLRRPNDGGRYGGSEAERQTILRQAIVSGVFEWVDLETDIATAIPRFGKVKRIISYHNFSETPATLDEIYAKMLEQDADVYKLAVTAHNPEDLVRVLKLQQAAPKPTVAFCMGDIGQPSRFLALKYGAPWIYAAFNKERGIAPGLPSLDDFKTTYPVQSIAPETRIYGVLGDPVDHSLSPLLHNQIYKKLGVNALYLPFRVPRGMLPQAVEAYESIPVHGYSVTIPHKEAAAQLAREKELNVEVTQAANTLVRRPDGKFQAANTDYSAAVDSLKAHLAERAGDGEAVQMSQLSVMVLGAGGVARAIAFALHREGAQLTITGRTYERAQRLAEEVKCKAVDWHARHNVSFDVLINCTPVGMHPNVDESPCHFSILKPNVTVFDTIYRPETTLLLREARTRGCHTITGVDMFVRQAARQIEMFIGQTPDQAAMRDIMRRALSPLTKAFSEESEKGKEQEPTTEHTILPANTTPSRIILIGYRGTGKTSVGRLLAHRLGWSFADSDDAIESATGRSIAKIFSAEGEAGFRKHEAAALGELSKREAIVIATGGGAVLRPENRDLLRSAGFVAWLTARPETIRDRLRDDPQSAQRRPKLTPAGGIEEIRQLLAEREPLYRETAHFVADADAPSPEAVAAAILKAWPGSNSSPSSSGA